RAGLPDPDPDPGPGPRPVPTVPAWIPVPVGFLAGSIPWSNLVARRVVGVDLRRIGSGTVSGTGLFEVAGFAPLALAGVMEVAKGAVGPLLAGPQRPRLAAAAGAAAVAGHNWSPWLRGAGGRGLSPALGALGISAPAASVTLLGGMAGGRLVRQTAIGSLAAELAAIPVARRTRGPAAGWAAVGVVIPMIVKRLAGNARPTPGTSKPYVWRLLLDRDRRRCPPTTSLTGGRL
ncbi:MAG: glycerol-3-phosphate acyltransferase, partial [Actinomycetota bacterium]|nr:glycerol-3-phosphate acyltransferase [Actinomycetota bacterium]